MVTFSIHDTCYLHVNVAQVVPAWYHSPPCLAMLSEIVGTRYYICQAVMRLEARLLKKNCLDEF
jgi:hypothetical protein